MVGNVLNDDDLGIILGPDYVPEGSYCVRLSDMSLNLTKDNDHHYIMADFEIISGDFSGRKIKQIWSFRLGQECRTAARINNYLSKVTSEKVVTNNNTIILLFDKIRNKLMNEKFIVWFIKDVDKRSELLYAKSCCF